MPQKTLTATHGIRLVYLALMDPDTGKVITGPEGLSESGFVFIDGDGQGATTANVTALEEKGTKKYGNNKTKRIAHGIPAPEVALTMLDLPQDIYRKVLGYTKSGNGWVLNTNRKPHVAMIIANDDYSGHIRYTAFANGEIIEATQNHGTDTNNQTEADPTLTFDALAPIDDDIFVDATGDQQIVGFYNSGDDDFSEQKMFDEVFLGNKATDGKGDPANDKGTISIAVHYQDDEGKNLTGLDDKTLTGQSGDSYTIETPTVEGYVYEKSSLPLTGTFAVSEKAVVTYKKQEIPSNNPNSDPKK